MKIPLRDRVLVITGASSGIGRATAVQAARAGMRVVVSARRVERLREVVHEITTAGGQALALPCDVTSDRDTTLLIDHTVRQWGRVDAVFANAGYGMYATVLETSDAQYREIFETNFYGTLRVLKAAALVMLRQRNVSPRLPGGRELPGGHLLICTSAASEVSPPMYGAYAATKAAQDAIGASLRAELADDGIFVSTVHPIPTSTEFFDHMEEHAAPGRTVARSPALFSQSAEQVAAAVVRCLRKPVPEVWPHLPTRLGAGIAAAFPSLTAWALRRHMAKLRAGA